MSTIRDEIGFWIYRDEILHQLYEWGYNTTLMSVYDVDESGYWQYVRKDNYLMLDEENNPIRHRTKWIVPDHFEWLQRTISDIKRSS